MRERQVIWENQEFSFEHVICMISTRHPGMDSD